MNKISKRFNYKSNSGQTLVITVLVMLILMVIAMVFIALVGRNLFRSQRYSTTDSVAQIAEAGIRFADEMLTSSEEGADWRPVPDNISVQTPAKWDPVTRTLTPPVPLPDEDWQFQRDRNPDFQWTRAYWPVELPEGSALGTGYAGPTGGFTTFNHGGGRFLLKVSYEPDKYDPLSKYIRIESIGRWGELDPEDPTTLRPHGNPLLRRELVAYKPIGITDYLRFVTNKDKKNTYFSLGAPDYVVNYGRGYNNDPAAPSRYGFRAGPIRVNGNLMWYGNYSSNQNDVSVRIFLRGVYAYDESGNATGVTIPVDRVEVAGKIKSDADMNNPANKVNVEVRTLFPGNAQTSGFLGLDSDDPNFNTGLGFYMDSSDETADPHRRIRRIEPPLVDQRDTTGTTTRYRVLTLNSGERIDGNINLGAYGWGQGIYISNRNDKQADSETLFGGYTLREDIMKPNNKISNNWVGPYYVPPGVVITLNPFDTDGDGEPDITITRTDMASRRNRALWVDYSGNERRDWGQTITMPYPDPVRGRLITERLGGPPGGKRIQGNGVIFAEGNIRIRGMLPPGMQLTVVSNENIYIDGNLLKYRDPQMQIPDDDPYRGADSLGSIALLARRNVIVNTTQFFAPINSISADDIGSDTGSGEPPFHVVVSQNPQTNLRFLFSFGPFESETGNEPSERSMVLRHAGQYGASYINAWLNPSDMLDRWGIIELNRTPGGGAKIVPNLPDYVFGVGDPNFGLGGIDSTFVGDVFPLVPAVNAYLNEQVGMPNILQIALDQTTITRNNYQMGGFAIQPADIRIEAVIYAQEGSFFVIPGNWFNPNVGDTRGAGNARYANPEFPFHGEPLDVRIIIDGAVAENTTAPIGDLSEWMRKWSNIPSRYGSSNIQTAHPGEGITLLYDDHAGWPLADLDNNADPIRRDSYGRPLPFTPRLPVCTSLVYIGDPI
ncbi:MAG: hypothetical protein SNJ70_03865 [Armatimonadota bacterium]